MSQKSQDDETYGPPLDNGKELLPEEVYLPDKKYNTGMNNFAAKEMAKSSSQQSLSRREKAKAQLNSSQNNNSVANSEPDVPLIAGKRGNKVAPTNGDDFAPGDSTPALSNAQVGEGGFFNSKLKQVYDHIQENLVKSLEKDITRGKKKDTGPPKEGKEALIEKAQELNYFKGQATSIMKYNGKGLQAQEPERDFSPTMGYVKLAVLLVVGVLACIYIVYANFSKIGSEKSQQVSILKYNDLSYMIGNDDGGIQKLFPLHFFTTFNRQEVLDRMNCLINDNTELCIKYEERKCEVFGLKSSSYDTCMLIQYEIAEKDLRSFCNSHYNTSNGLWTKAEYTSNSFFVAKHECLKNAGVKRGVEYCDDKNIQNPSYTKKELYKCYIENKVLNSTFADDKCNFESPKNSKDASVRAAYETCMGKMKVAVSDKWSCLNKNYWVYDVKLVNACEKMLKDMNSGGGSQDTGGSEDTGGVRRLLEEVQYTLADCETYLNTAEQLQGCYMGVSNLKYDIDTCNTLTWLEYTLTNFENNVFDFNPPPKNYFDCYFSKTQLKDEPSYAPQIKAACQSLYTGDQRKLLECYKEHDIAYTLDDEILICSEQYTKRSQIEDLYTCMKEFEVEKSEEYCNLNPTDTCYYWEEDIKLHVPVDCQTRKNKEPYFQCLKDNSEHKTTDTRYCYTDVQLNNLNREFDPENFVLDINFDSLETCLKEQQQPPTGIQNAVCTLKHLFTQPTGYKTTGKYCEDMYDDFCYNNWIYYTFTDDDCNSIYQYEYKSLFNGTALFESDFKIQCKKVVVDLTEYNKCMGELTDEAALAEMNTNFENYLTSVGDAESFAPFETLDNKTKAAYCTQRYSEEKDIHNQIICMQMIGQSYGPKRCEMIPENNPGEKFHFSYFSKYTCLMLDKVQLDSPAVECYGDFWDWYAVDANDEWWVDIPFVTINECLRKYENVDDTYMKLKTINGVDIYTQVALVKAAALDSFYVEEDEEPVVVYDKPANVTDEQIQDFLCGESMALYFHTSPYSVKQKTKYIKQNAMSFRMGCETFMQFNGTNNNIVVHFQFMKRENEMGYEAAADAQDQKYSKDKLAVNRTDTNEQYFNLTMGEFVDFLQVQSHMLYKYEEDESKNHFIRNGEQFEEFIGNAHTSSVFKTGQMIVADQITDAAELEANPYKIIEIGKKVTRRVLGVGVQFVDVQKKQIQISKVNTELGVKNKADLSRSQKREMKSFIMHLRVGFSEQTVIYQFFSFLDIVSLLGGLWATFKSLTAQLGVVSIVMFVFNLAQMIRRKDNQRCRVIECKQYLKHMPRIRKEIEVQLTDKPTKTNEDLKQDLEKIQRAEELEMLRYDVTQEKHDLLVEILQKYYPHGLVDIFGLQSCTSEWEMLENVENESKHKYYEIKKEFSLIDISDEIKERMSFYGLYMTKDRQEMSALTVKKIKYQLKNANERLMEQEKINQELVDQVNELKKKLN